MSNVTKDLIILTPDRDTKAAIEGLLSRPQAIGIRSLEVDIFTHSQHDSGCYGNGTAFLSAFTEMYRYAILIFDYEGCGAENKSVGEIERELENELNTSGWNGRADVVIICPELENWVWSDSPHVDRELGWSDETVPMREWLISKGFLDTKNAKPTRPKEAMEAVLYKSRKPRSSSIYKSLAGKVSFQRCTDSSFNKFLNVLKTWFSL